MDSPTAAANSAIENSATSGAPGPATGTAVSPNPPAYPEVRNTSAASSDSAGCWAAQTTAACKQLGLGPIRHRTPLPRERQHLRRGIEIPQGRR